MYYRATMLVCHCPMDSLSLAYAIMASSVLPLSYFSEASARARARLSSLHLPVAACSQQLVPSRPLELFTWLVMVWQSGRGKNSRFLLQEVTFGQQLLNIFRVVSALRLTKTHYHNRNFKISRFPAQVTTQIPGLPAPLHHQGVGVCIQKAENVVRLRCYITCAGERIELLEVYDKFTT